MHLSYFSWLRGHSSTTNWQYSNVFPSMSNVLHTIIASLNLFSSLWFLLFSYWGLGYQPFSVGAELDLPSHILYNSHNSLWFACHFVWLSLFIYCFHAVKDRQFYFFYIFSKPLVKFMIDILSFLGAWKMWYIYIRPPTMVEFNIYST